MKKFLFAFTLLALFSNYSYGRIIAKVVIRSDFNQKYVIDLDHGVAREGQNIFLNEYHGGINQQWFLDIDDIYGDLVIRSCVDPDYCIGLSDGNLTNTKNVVLTKYRLQKWQRWTLFDNIMGTYAGIISCANHTFCLDVENAMAAGIRNGTNLSIWPYHKQKNQNWYFDYKESYV